MVRTGKGATYSKGWPKLPENDFNARRGKIVWSWRAREDMEALNFVNSDLARGYYFEASPGECRFLYESCDCFERASP